jgi:hypothetical protein
MFLVPLVIGGILGIDAWKRIRRKQTGSRLWLALIIVFVTLATWFNPVTYLLVFSHVITNRAARMGAYQGADESVFIQRWGVPDDRILTPDGTVLYYPSAPWYVPFNLDGDHLSVTIRDGKVQAVWLAGD